MLYAVRSCYCLKSASKNWHGFREAAEEKWLTLAREFTCKGCRSVINIWLKANKILHRSQFSVIYLPRRLYKSWMKKAIGISVRPTGQAFVPVVYFSTWRFWILKGTGQVTFSRNCTDFVYSGCKSNWIDIQPKNTTLYPKFVIQLIKKVLWNYFFIVAYYNLLFIYVL